MRLRAMDERDMTGVEAEVWSEIADAANATFNWLAFTKSGKHRVGLKVRCLR